jgi:hypothetical protein
MFRQDLDLKLLSVISMEAGGEAAGVNIGSLAGLRCESLTHGSVTSVEAVGEAAGVNVGGLADPRFEVVTYGCVTSVEAEAV